MPAVRINTAVANWAEKMCIIMKEVADAAQEEWGHKLAELLKAAKTAQFAIQ
jgi:hypothetical protein